MDQELKGILNQILDRLDKQDAKIDAMDAKFESKFDAMDAKFESKFEAMDAKWEKKFDMIMSEVAVIKEDVTDIRSTMATKEDISKIWDTMATKDDVTELKEELGFVDYKVDVLRRAYAFQELDILDLEHRLARTRSRHIGTKTVKIFHIIRTK